MQILTLKRSAIRCHVFSVVNDDKTMVVSWQSQKQTVGITNGLEHSDIIDIELYSVMSQNIINE